MNKILVAIALAAVTFAGCFSSGGGSRGGMTVSMETEPMKVAQSIGTDKMREAIVRGGQKRDWAVKSEKPGCVTLLLSVRAGKHTVTVDVNYTADSFAVKYVDSTNMDYDPATGTIRKKYIQWVRNLKQEIWREASLAK